SSGDPSSVTPSKSIPTSDEPKETAPHIPPIPDEKEVQLDENITDQGIRPDEDAAAHNTQPDAIMPDNPIGEEQTIL
ncbi:hypothetical protein A2U01_0099756, partial [Trifolium medium]|nr:hypothetical protein [Trifolium medium]